MKRYLIFLAIILGMIVPSVSAQTTAKKKVAVYVTGDAESGYKKVIGSKLVTGITRSEGYAAVERTADFLAELTKEQDYQMSGAVSDNQIARLGQQFGVRYVLVADISQVFESMFISARMIDVQTAQITKSTEADAVVDNMESLSKIAEAIVLRLFYAREYTKDEIKILGPFSTLRALVGAQQEGYHIASAEEIKEIIKNNNLLNKETLFPIYADIKETSTPKEESFLNHFNGEYGVTLQRQYFVQSVSYIIFTSSTQVSSSNQDYVVDDSYSDHYRIGNSNGFQTSGLYDHSTDPSITSGYVYLIKD